VSTTRNPFDLNWKLFHTGKCSDRDNCQPVIDNAACVGGISFK